MRVLVLMGGSSAEREVSLSTGQAVARGLRARGHEVLEYDFNPAGGNDVRSLFASSVLSKIDVVFIGLHGGEGEDGRIQAFLELAGVVYTGSGVRASSICMDKIATKIFFEHYNIPTPRWFSVDGSAQDLKSILRSIDTIGGLPIVVKPADQGSAIGVSIVRDAHDLEQGMKTAQGYSRKILCEKYIEGRELSVPILGDTVLPIVEIEPKQGFYDYRRKYTKGMTNYTCPARLDEQATRRIQEIAMKAYTALGCSCLGRLDLRLSDDGIPYFLEVNTIPGMTETSLVPMAAAAVGISFEDLVERIVTIAMDSKGKRSVSYGG